jgi:hypothetical protein
MNLFEKISNKLYELDIEGLIKMGAPYNEYDNEAKKYVILVMDNVDINFKDVELIWLKSFLPTNSAPFDINFNSERKRFYYSNNKFAVKMLKLTEFLKQLSKELNHNDNTK